jgi:hypothetical protein
MQLLLMLKAVEMVFKRPYAVLLLLPLVLVQHKCNKFAEGMLLPTLLLLAVVV